MDNVSIFEGWGSSPREKLLRLDQGLLTGNGNFPEENGDTIRDIFSVTLEPGPVPEWLTKRG
jgi:hypothetical protein